MSGGRQRHFGATPGVLPTAYGPTGCETLGDLSEKRRAGPADPHAAHNRRAHDAPKHVSQPAARVRTLCRPGAHTARPRTSHDVQPARLPAHRTGHLSARRATCLPARRTARSRRAEQRAHCAQDGALAALRTARLSTCRAACFSAGG